MDVAPWCWCYAYKWMWWCMCEGWGKEHLTVLIISMHCFPKPHVRATVVGVAPALWRCSSRFISRPQTSEQRPPCHKKGVWGRRPRGKGTSLNTQHRSKNPPITENGNIFAQIENNLGPNCSIPRSACCEYQTTAANFFQEAVGEYINSSQW